MSSLARPTRILRGAPAAPASSAAAAEDEVFVVAGSVARALGLPGPVASAAGIIAAAEAQAAGLLEAARSEAALLVTAARAEAAATREAARSEGFASGLANGRASATAEAAACSTSSAAPPRAGRPYATSWPHPPMQSSRRRC